MAKTGLQRLTKLGAYINMPPGPARSSALQACLLGLKRYLEDLESTPKNPDAEDLVALRQQVQSLQTINADLETRILDLEEVKSTLGETLRETKQSLANERRATTRLTKRIEDAAANTTQPTDD